MLRELCEIIFADLGSSLRISTFYDPNIFLAQVKAGYFTAEQNTICLMDGVFSGEKLNIMEQLKEFQMRFNVLVDISTDKIPEFPREMVDHFIKIDGTDISEKLRAGLGLALKNFIEGDRGLVEEISEPQGDFFEGDVA